MLKPIGVALLSSLLSISARAELSYHIVPLETVPGDTISLSDINDHDQIIGAVASLHPLQITPEIWKNGSMNAIPSPKGSDLYALGINNSNTVVGDIVKGNTETGYVWHGKGITNLPELPGDVGSEATDINDSGEIVGALRTQSGAQAATWTTMGPAVLHIANNAVWSEAEAVNANGDVVGEFQDTNAVTHGFIDRNGQITWLPSLGGMHDDVFDINQHDQAVGESQVGGDHHSQAVLWQNGQVQALQSLPNSSYSSAFAINDAGQVVGDSFGQQTQATLWNNGTPVNLTSLLPANSGWQLTTADAINNRGQIVGMGNFKGVEEPFLMTPTSGNAIPLPSPLLIGATTFPLAILSARRKRIRL